MCVHMLVWCGVGECWRTSNVRITEFEVLPSVFIGDFWGGTTKSSSSGV